MDLLFPLALLSVGYIFVAQTFTGWIVNLIFGSIISTAEKMNNEPDSGESLRDEIKKELVSLRAVEVKKKSLGYLTKIIGWFELISSAVLVATVLISGGYTLSTLSILGAFLAGWIAIKVVGNYGQWSGEIFGRASFYAFLIGTFVNIIWGVLLGVTFLLLWPYLSIK